MLSMNKVIGDSDWNNELRKPDIQYTNEGRGWLYFPALLNEIVQKIVELNTIQN